MEPLYEWVRDAVVNGRRPSEDASVEEIRRLGLRLAGIGILLLTVGIGLYALILWIVGMKPSDDPGFTGELSVLLTFPGFAAIVVGGYRALGSEPTTDGSSPTKRIAVGVSVGCLSLVLILPIILILMSIAKGGGSSSPIRKDRKAPRVASTPTDTVPWPMSSSPTEPGPAPRLVFRVDSEARADGCDGDATQVFVGMDVNANGLLGASEQQPEPMSFCRGGPVAVEILDAPPNAYCSLPGAVLMIRFKDDPPEPHAELLVCFGASRREIASTYAVYMAK